MRKASNITSIILLLFFVVKTALDYINYDPLTNSAPFYTWIIINIICLIIPAALIFIIGRLFKK